MLTREEMLGYLETLLESDIDALHAYDRLLQETPLASARAQISRCRAEHQRHADAWSALIRELGGAPPAITREWSGFYQADFAIARSQTGTEGALRAMQNNEKLTNALYALATEWDLAAGPAALVGRYLEDERRHLHALQEILGERAWEKSDWHARTDSQAGGEQRPNAA